MRRSSSGPHMISGQDRMGVPKPLVLVSGLTTTYVVPSLPCGVIVGHMTVFFTGLQALWRGDFSYSSLVLQLIGIFVHFI